MVNAPLGAERDVHPVLSHDGKDRLSRSRKFGILRGFSNQETVERSRLSAHAEESD
jgi:hypothetical protein